MSDDTEPNGLTAEELANAIVRGTLWEDQMPAIQYFGFREGEKVKRRPSGAEWEVATWDKVMGMQVEGGVIGSYCHDMADESRCVPVVREGRMGWCLPDDLEHIETTPTIAAVPPSESPEVLQARAEIRRLNDMIGGEIPRPTCECERCRALRNSITRRDALTAFVEGRGNNPEDEVFGARETAEDPNGIFGARMQLAVGQFVRPTCPEPCRMRGSSCVGRSDEGFTIERIADERAWFGSGMCCPLSALTVVTRPERLFDPNEEEEDIAYCPRCSEPLDGDGNCENCSFPFDEDEEDYEDSEPVPEEEEDMSKELLINEENIDVLTSKLAPRDSGIRYMRELLRWAGERGDAMRQESVAFVKAFTELAESKWDDDNDNYDKNVITVCETVPRIYKLADAMNHGMLEEIRKEMRSRSRNKTKSDIYAIQALGLVRNFEKVYYIEKDNKVAVETTDCMAKGINFGPFRITYWIDAGHLRLHAMKPNSPKGVSRSLVHPHVDSQDGTICLGGASSAFIKAAREGRACDALLLVRAVLNEYGSNPYHSIDYWKRDAVASGAKCQICGTNASEECRGCKTTLCTTHAFQCARCGSYVCHDHVQRCRDCNNILCGPCRREEKTCGMCSGKSAAVQRGDAPAWASKVEEFKELAAAAAKDGKVPAKRTSDVSRLGGGFLE